MHVGTNQANWVVVILVYHTSNSSDGAMKVFMYFVQSAILFTGEGLEWADWMKVRLHSKHALCRGGS